MSQGEQQRLIQLQAQLQRQEMERQAQKAREEQNARVLAEKQAEEKKRLDALLAQQQAASQQHQQDPGMDSRKSRLPTGEKQAPVKAVAATVTLSACLPVRRRLSLPRS